MFASQAPATDSEPALRPNLGAEPANKFAIFSSDFVKLQLATVQALALPIAQDDFEKRYGKCNAAVPNCVAGLKKLNEHCQKFGNPATLVHEISQLAAGTKPTMLYGQIVWVAQRITDTANSFRFTLESVAEVLGATESKEKRHRILTRLLVGEGGLVTEARAMETAARTLRTDLLAYLAEMKVVRAPIDEYFSQKSALYLEAEEMSGLLSSELKQMQEELDDYRSRYIGMVGGAIACGVFTGLSIGLGFAVLGIGFAMPLGVLAAIPLLIAAGIAGTATLSVQAEQTRDNINKTQDKVDQLGLESRQKAQLLIDINGLTLAVGPIEAHLAAVSQSLSDVANVWQRVAESLAGIVAHASPDALLDLKLFDQLYHISAGYLKWKETARLTQEFTSNAFVQVESVSTF